MKQMIETFVTVFIVLLAVFLIAQFIGASTQISAAKKFHSNCIGQIESSDFDTVVIQTCKKNAVKNSYKLDVESVTESSWICKNCNSIWEENSSLKCPNCNSEKYTVNLKERFCTVDLEYVVKIGILGIEKKGVLSGYAR